MEVQLPKLTFTDLVLTPEQAPTRKTPVVDVDEVVTIGGPVSVPVKLEDIPEDDEARPFIADRADEFAFYLLHLSCTVPPRDGDQLTQVSLEFDLSRADGKLPGPTAVSMTPERLDKPVELSRTIKLGAALKAIDAEVQRVEKSVKDEVYLQALNLHRSDPGWQLYRTPLVPIRGMQKFVMVVQAPKVTVNGSLGVKVTMKHKKLGLLPYKASHEDATPVTFTLPG
jgi:hypothetical protein